MRNSAHTKIIWYTLKKIRKRIFWAFYEIFLNHIWLLFFWIKVTECHLRNFIPQSVFFCATYLHYTTEAWFTHPPLPHIPRLRFFYIIPFQSSSLSSLCIVLLNIPSTSFFSTLTLHPPFRFTMFADIQSHIHGYQPFKTLTQLSIFGAANVSLLAISSYSPVNVGTAFVSIIGLNSPSSFQRTLYGHFVKRKTP